MRRSAHCPSPRDAGRLRRPPARALAAARALGARARGVDRAALPATALPRRREWRVRPAWRCSARRCWATGRRRRRERRGLRAGVAAAAADRHLRGIGRCRQDHGRRGARARGGPPRPPGAGAHDRSGAAAGGRAGRGRARQSARGASARGPGSARRPSAGGPVRADARHEADLRRPGRALRRHAGDPRAHPREPDLSARLGGARGKHRVLGDGEGLRAGCAARV